MIPDSDIERVLIVTAHPDDLDFGCAGTIAGWTKSGIEVSYCIITNGDAGGFDPEVPRWRIPEIRQEEQRAAARAVGVNEDDIHFLGYHDGRLVASLELRRDISRMIRKVRPQRIVVQTPDRDFDNMYISHPDHLAAGEAALCAVYPDSRNPFAHPELLLEQGWKEWTVDETWIMTRKGANHFVDITDVFEVKMQAIFAHVSQTEHDPQWFVDHVGDMNREIAVENGLAGERMAESFRVIDTSA